MTGAATVQDVIQATEWVRAVVRVNLDVADPMQQEFSIHVSYVFNQIFQTIRKQGLTTEGLTAVGKLLWRLYIVYIQYKTKSKELSQKEWLTQLMLLCKELGSVVNDT